MYEIAEEVSTVSVKKLSKESYKNSDPDHYQIVWIEQGIRSVTIDFQEIPFYPNSIYFVLPGKVLKLKFSCELPKGWVLQFSRSFFREQYLEGLNIKNADIFYSNGEIPRIALSPKIGQRIDALAEMIAEVMQSQIPNREMAASSLVKTLLVYCDSKCNIRVTNNSNNHHLNLVSMFKQLVSRHLNSRHRVSEYAEMMKVSPKYLNQVVKMVMGVTAKSVILEQLMIQSCRDLKFSNESIKEIAIKLGFSEQEHFSNFFKKTMGCSPSTYRHG
jgi:AraC family transcriptional regulator, transcriptional activator of pobA